MKIEQLARKTVQQLTPYQSARSLGSSGDIWLNANESPFHNEVADYFEHLNRYSVCQPEALVNAYAAYAGVDSSQVLVSRGADEGIELLIRTFCEQGEESILYCPPTYGMYAVSAEIAGVDRKLVPLKDQWQLDLSGIEKKLDSVKLVFLCNPNNPTGSLISQHDIKELLELTCGRALIVVDEAYIDFCPELSVTDLLVQYPHLVILRTLSKAFALAGLRCGFALANREVIQLLLKVIAPYPIPVPVEKIAVQVLSEAGVASMTAQKNRLNANRSFLFTALSALEGVTVFEGAGNFLLVRFSDAEKIFRLLWNQGITVRRTDIQQCLRISIGSIDELKALIKTVKSELAVSGGEYEKRKNTVY
ncbi:histidinol-phosphate transaminase [Endozoicomonas sp.]|nr:histidinol-phosphate transaminase [Endozoicomonas sp.]